MRKIMIVATLSTAALVLAACSETVEAPAEEVAVEAPGEDAAEEALVVLDANTATLEQLTEVAGVSPELADAIVAGQPYADVVALNEVLTANLSAEEASAVLVNVFVPVDLNDQSEEAVALIPGMTDRMIHEFEEYAPYEDVAEFDREIGKYVDEEEVARLRTYVTL